LNAETQRRGDAERIEPDGGLPVFHPGAGERSLPDVFEWMNLALPKKPAAPNPAIVSRFDTGCRWRGVGEPGP
jgi:hypothetical protein